MLKRIRSTRGFTLIELLIALIVIGMIVALLVGLFGNPVAESSVKQAATKIADDMRTIDDASQQLLTNKTIEANGFVDAVDATASKGLVTAGMLKAPPVAPSQAFPAGVTATDIYAFSTAAAGYAGAAYTAWKDNANADTVIVLPASAAGTVSDSVCKKINELYSGLAENAAIPAAVSGSKDIQCYGPGGDANFVVKPIYVK